MFMQGAQRNSIWAKHAGLICLTALTFAGTPSFAQQPPKLSGAQCDPPALKKLVIDELNGSSELAKRKIKIIDYKSDKLLVSDPAKNTIACHTTMVIANGQRFSGVLTVAAPGDKTDIDWYDDDAEKGLMRAASLPMPPDQTRFVEILVKARGAYEEARTERGQSGHSAPRQSARSSNQLKRRIGSVRSLA
ncbi:hypothetical protein IVB33_17200 [Bradyrhizobium sp. 24]|uniref:hypothetical protein n=1 Tax=unclassified Bradyrhizobium TaxID=2631580 RepID=UPI001FF71B25|nr:MULTISPECIES: hypothetical protein [unclassified Bradyrhizobium]MCK1303792.1 hypothetical protein [Bradyrhizobium sp. 37]MCK1379355.1 hypothetical protein [Bradyrhizobium sp. 24]MCK1770310.1 hypothetical protein [Bradyrhizobium sp. 134]